MLLKSLKLFWLKKIYTNLIPSKSYWDSIGRVDTALGSRAGSVSSSIVKVWKETILIQLNNE